MYIVCSIVGYWCPFSMSVSLIYIRQFAPLTIQWLPKPVSEFTYGTASLLFTSTIDSQVPISNRFNEVIMVMCSYCDAITSGDTLYKYKLIWSQLSTNRFVSPRASECTLSYIHWVHNGLTIVANDRTLNLIMLYWSQISSNLQLSWFARY